MVSQIIYYGDVEYIYNNIMQSSIPKIIITAKLSPLMDSTRGTTAHLLGSYDFERATAVIGITVSRRCCRCRIILTWYFLWNIKNIRRNRVNPTHISCISDHQIVIILIFLYSIEFENLFGTILINFAYHRVVLFFSNRYCVGS